MEGKGWLFLQYTKKKKLCQMCEGTCGFYSG